MKSATLGSQVAARYRAPGKPTFVNPVRMGDCPVINAARPAVQTLLPIPIGEPRTFLGDAVDVWRFDNP